MKDSCLSDFRFITCLLMSDYSKSYVANFFKIKKSYKIKYSFKRATFLVNSKMIWVFQARYVVIFDFKLRKVLKPTNIFFLGSNTMAANFFWLIIYTYLVINKTLAKVKNL